MTQNGHLVAVNDMAGDSSESGCEGSDGTGVSCRGRGMKGSEEELGVAGLSS